MSLERWKKISAYGVLIIFEALLVSYVLIVAYDFPITFLNINPPPKEVFIPVTLIYPDSYTLGPDAGLSISFNLVADSTIGEGTIVRMIDPFAQVLSKDYSDVVILLTGFAETVPTNFVPTQPQRGQVVNVPPAGTMAFTGPTREGTYVPMLKETTFKWVAPGDYSPRLFFQFLNHTKREYTYNEIKIHVASFVELQGLKVSKIELALTYSLLAFGVLEGFSIVDDFVSKKTTRKHNLPTSANTQSPESEPQSQLPKTK